MKKILVSAGARPIGSAPLDFACYLARLTDSRLTGIFLEPLKHEERLTVVGRGEEAHLDFLLDTESFPANVAIRSHCDREVKRFRDACDAREVHSAAHRDRGLPWDELIDECRYADVMIADPDFSFNPDGEESHPSPGLQRLLHEAECPVLLAPQSAPDEITNVVLTHDGTPSSAFAIRQFMHLFPEFEDATVTVVEVSADGADFPAVHHHLKEWLGCVYPVVEFENLRGEPEDILLAYLLNRPRTLVVMGGYGRGRWSRMFHASTSEQVVRTVPAPIFIAHR